MQFLQNISRQSSKGQIFYWRCCILGKRPCSTFWAVLTTINISSNVKNYISRYVPFIFCNTFHIQIQNRLYVKIMPIIPAPWIGYTILGRHLQEKILETLFCWAAIVRICVKIAISSSDILLWGYICLTEIVTSLFWLLVQLACDITCVPRKLQF